MNSCCQKLSLACLATCLVLAGCKSSPATATAPPDSAASTPPASTTPAQTDSSQPQAAALTAAVGKPYDFYLFNLSWSPEYCATDPGSPECASHPGFVVHGLWPENNDGTYPENCASRPGPTSPSVWQGLMPTQALATHEWVTHGTCTPYDADTYFGLVRKAYGEVKIPPAFTHTTVQTSEPPAAIIAQFAAIDTGFPKGSLAVSCVNNELTAMEVCFNKNLQAIACSGVKSCSANAVKIAPQ